ncbi:MULTISPECIES: hypothetical protein [Parabacteroides]|uniref:hypothetical protein n=1 Tax=Parabacteroides TaxID=375288 RepID=UPI0011C3A49F|nr:MULTISPECIES: hypothetical protein [Parabacteroides]
MIALTIHCSVRTLSSSAGVVRITSHPQAAASLYFSMSRRQPSGRKWRPPFHKPPSTSMATWA